MVVAVLAVLWNVMGALDFTMAQTHNEAYLKALTPEQLAFIQEGLRGVVANPQGTAHFRFLGMQIPVYGKTGTADVAPSLASSRCVQHDLPRRSAHVHLELDADDRREFRS